MELTELTDQTKKRLRKLAKIIVKQHKHFNMNEWCRTNCETVGCIAGFCVVEFDKRVWKSYEKGLKFWAGPTRTAEESKIRHVAEKYLGLTSDQSNNIFFTSGWPYPFEERFDDAESTKGKAIVAAEYLVAIADGKVELGSCRAEYRPSRG